ncbi:hypothetical protein KR009_007809, partial [Drosophila setifemur]
MQRIVVVVALMACGSLLVAAQNCQECQADNDVYCYNQTSYQYCMGDVTIGDVENCPTGYVCSNSDSVCVETPSATALDVCGSSGNGVGCADCSANAKYVCVSSTQYVRCSSGNPLTSIVFSCNADEICVNSALESYQFICVPSCAANFASLEATCSNSEYLPVTTTAAPTTTPSPAAREEACRDAQPSTSPRFWYTRNYADSTCNSYLYCQSSGTTSWVAILLNCGTASPFYDATRNMCLATRPASCSVTLPPATDAPVTSASTSAPSTGDSSTAEPTSAPSTDPTSAPSTDPTSAPSTDPTSAPSTEPTSAPSTDPTSAPSTEPTSAPSTDPTSAPSTDP